MWPPTAPNVRESRQRKYAEVFTGYSGFHHRLHLAIETDIKKMKDADK